MAKATQLVTALHTNLEVDNNPKLLLKTCEVLKKQESLMLDTIVVNISEQLGKLQDYLYFYTIKTIYQKCYMHVYKLFFFHVFFTAPDSAIKVNDAVLDPNAKVK